jgi:hypothetical protein
MQVAPPGQGADALQLAVHRPTTQTCPAMQSESALHAVGGVWLCGLGFGVGGGTMLRGAQKFGEPATHVSVDAQSESL